MELEKIESKIAKVFTDKPEEFSYTVAPANWYERLLQRLKIKPKKRTFHMRNLSIDNVVNLAAVGAGVAADSLKLGGRAHKRNMYRFVTDHAGKLVYAVAVGITNCEGEPPMWLLKELRHNVENARIQEAALRIYERSNIEVFISTTALIFGQDILTQAGQEITGETIAPGPLSEESQSISEPIPNL